MGRFEDIFNERKDNPLYNTSYPLSPKDWKQYETVGELPLDDWKLSIYIHIPFCRQACSFCEYTRMTHPSDETQHLYMSILKRDVDHFLEQHPSILLEGCDIGGGTPTTLNVREFDRLMDIYHSIISHSIQTEDFEPSIEATFRSLDTSRMFMIADAGIKRISFGLQSSDNGILERHMRDMDTIKNMARTIENAITTGIRKVNIDLMYGLKGQTWESVDSDMKAIQRLSPQQVTIYELRTNMNGYSITKTKDELFMSYCRYYEALVEMGYHAEFGQNTFSKSPNDKGVSSYLRHRMTECSAYKGFGISAQSMSRFGVSYNILKGSRFSEKNLNVSSFVSGKHYRLPPSEIVSKYIAISAYHGRFSLAKVSEILGEDARQHFRKIICFCIDNGLINIEGDTVSITRDGFRYYGAVFSLFYLPPQIQ